MIAITIILGVVALLLLVIAAYRAVTEYEGMILGSLGILLGVAWFIMFMLISNMKLSDDTYTGYIYSKDSFAGVTRYHIRFSENAGEDAQPSFCVNSDAPSKKALDELVGSGKKVTVDISSVGWYFSNDLWHCASNARLKSVEETE